MGGVGFTEMLLLAVIALIVVGPQKLPKIARTAGRITRQARNAWQGLQSELQAELDAEHNRKIMDSTRAMMDKATGPFSTDPDEDSDGQGRRKSDEQSPKDQENGSDESARRD